MSQTESVVTGPDEQVDRHELLRELDLLESPPDDDFDRLMTLAVRLLDTALAQVTFVADDREWITSSAGLDLESLDTVRSVCEKTLADSSSPTYVSDISAEPEVDGDGTFIADKAYRSYAGFPITVRGTAVGAFCVWDENPREWTDRDRENLRLIADQVQGLIGRRERDRKLSEDARRLERYRTIIENLPVGVFRTTPEGEIINANPAVLSIMRADSEDHLKRHNLREIYEDSSRRDEIIERLREEGSVEGEEVKARRLDGESFWALLSLRSVEEDGEEYIDGTVRDITERREAKNELESTLRRLELTTQAGGVGIWEWRVEEDDVYYNEKLTELIGHEAGTYEEFISHLHPEDQSRVQEAIKTAVESEETYHEVFRVEHGDSGEIRWIEAQGELRTDAEGGAVLHGTALDVTDREEAYRSLEKSEERFRSIVNNTQDFFTVVNEEGEVLYESPAVETVLGYDQEELIGDSAFDYIHPEDLDHIAETFDELLNTETETYFREECRLRDADGNWVWLEIDGLSKYQPVWNGYLLSSRDITERKEAERELREREAQFREMADNVDEVFWMHDTELDEVIYVSPAAEDIWGEPQEVFLGSSERWLNSIVEADRDRVKEHFREHFNDEFDIEYRIEHADGEIRWIHDHGYPVRDDDGNVIRLVGTARDITERKRAEMELEATIEELRETTVSRNYLENIISTMPSTVMVVNEEGTIDRVNSALCELLGYDREELIGEGFGTVFAGGFSAEIEGLLDETGPEVVQNREVHYETKNGEELPVLFSASLLKDPKSEFEGLICVGLDITERKETQAALEESERRFRQVAENINEIIFMFSGDWSELLYVNSQYEEIWGQSIETIQEESTRFLNRIHSDDREKVRENMLKVAEGQQITTEFRVNDSGDHWRSVISEGVPIKNDKGEVIRIVGTVRDITELKRTQQELQQALNEKANLLKEVHHRVKNNMQIISSILSLHEQSDYRRPSRMLNECRNRITSMAMIHDMLYQSENLAEVSFAEYVEELVESLIRLNQVPEETVEVSINVASSLELPLSQAVPCGLIIHELVSNACKHAFSADRENKLNVEMRHFDDHVVLRVQDNGPGFPEDFDPDETGSVGMEILQALSEHELGGTLKFSEGPMTSVEVEFQLADVRL